MWNQTEDWAFIEDEGNLTLDTAIWDEVDSDRVPINGVVQPDGIADLQSTNKTVYQRGITTGTVDGIVAEMNMSSGMGCVDFSGEGVQVEGGGIFADGDSGGPVYEPRWYDGTEYAYIVNMGVQKENTCPDSQSCGFMKNTAEVCNGVRGTAFHQILGNNLSIYWN